MKISVFGLGYVGSTEIGCLSENDHKVIGVDKNKVKVDLINTGKSTIIEKGIPALIRKNFKKGKISATLNHKKAVLDTDVSLICVGTPGLDNGELNQRAVFAVAKEIGVALRKKDGFHVIAIRSTVLPGTNEKVTKLIAQKSRKKANSAFAVVSNPEFLREGSSLKDYYRPPFIVVGTDSNKARQIMRRLYRGISQNIIFTEIKIAEMIKIVSNAFHALKITFANEIGNICKKLNIDSHSMMELFCKDRTLNISPAYLKPGSAYGGSCLPKDLRLLNMLARKFYLQNPLVGAIEESNRLQKEIALRIITSTGKKKIGILGLSFKAGTDDLRNSSSVALVEQLLGKGFNVLIYDKDVVLSDLIGVNKQEIESKIPHIHRLITDNLYKVVKESQVLVITHHYPGLKKLVNKYPDKKFIDLARVIDRTSQANYRGICW